MGILSPTTTLKIPNITYSSDTIYGDSLDDLLYGDASHIWGTSKGGHDNIYGFAGSNTLYGDAYKMSWWAASVARMLEMARDLARADLAAEETKKGRPEPP